jgi:Protein of unknown function with PCYCGC motif
MKIPHVIPCSLVPLAILLVVHDRAPNGSRLPLSSPQSANAKGGLSGTSQSRCKEAKSAERHEHAYHREPPSKDIPKTLDPAEFQDNKAAFAAYSIAAKIPELLFQEPCYCMCDKFQGHTSLLDCYVARHGMVCHICQMEVLFINEQHNLGESAAEIRQALEEGTYSRLGLDHYLIAYSAQTEHERNQSHAPPAKH